VADFEESTGNRDFAKFRPEQAEKYKRVLRESIKAEDQPAGNSHIMEDYQWFLLSDYRDWAGHLKLFAERSPSSTRASRAAARRAQSRSARTTPGFPERVEPDPARWQPRRARRRLCYRYPAETTAHGRRGANATTRVHHAHRRRGGSMAASPLRSERREAGAMPGIIIGAGAVFHHASSLTCDHTARVESQSLWCAGSCSASFDHLVGPGE
jgi:hypothetical protein